MAQVHQPLRPLDTNKEPEFKKKREKLSALCKTPPALIRNKVGKDYERGLCLGEGGFARCFQVKDQGGQIYAAKTIAKASLRSEKTKTKLLAEIQIHKGLSHPNVVQFVDCFEDDTNVYILLEMCANQSLMDFVKKRKRLTEPEARFLTVQVIGAVSYMHSRRVIHRDLKLGNIFLDDDLNCKIGDFGLATMLDNDKDRKKTICGTPNYIAPEVLYGKEKGHSYEVDIWSIGIILYALLYGKPPFQSKDIDTIYERIKENEYQFPEHVEVSEAAKDLIRQILQADPAKRPSIDDMLKHEFFKGLFPRKLNSMCLTKTPIYRATSTQQSYKNFVDTQVASKLLTPSTQKRPISLLSKSALDDVKQQESSKVLPNSLSPASTKDKYKMVMLKKETKDRFKLRDLGLPSRREIKPNSAIYVKSVADAITRAMAPNNSNSSDEGDDGNQPAYTITATFIAKWVDYSAKYGLAYQMSDSKSGVLFLDKTSMLYNPNDEQFHKFKMMDVSKSRGNEWVTKTFDASDRKDAKRSKVVKTFHNYMQENLSMIPSNNSNSNGEPVYVTHYGRTDQAVMFQTNTGTFQFNFPDHVKLIISNQGHQLDIIDPERQIKSSSLQHAVSNAKNLKLVGNNKFNLLEKLAYCQCEIEKVWLEMVSEP